MVTSRQFEVVEIYGQFLLCGFIIAMLGPETPGKNRSILKK